MDCKHCFDAELVALSTLSIKRGKAARLDGLTAEHLINCHLIINVLLAKLFSLMLAHSCIPKSLCYSNTIPIPKSDNRSESMTYDDFRGISISYVISKVFENSILKIFDHFFKTKANQFGFKQNPGCALTLFTLSAIL